MIANYLMKKPIRLGFALNVHFPFNFKYVRSTELDKIRFLYLKICHN